MAYIYRHIRKDNGNTFYVGISNSTKKGYHRARNKSSRNSIWKKIVSKTDYIVEIILEGISTKDAEDLEALIINLYGRIDLKTGTLANLTDGGAGAINPSKAVADKKRSKLGIHSRKPCISFETGIEYESLSYACKVLSLVYANEKQTVAKKSKYAKFYYKDDYFERPLNKYKNPESRYNLCGKIVVSFETFVEYPSMREACRQVGANYGTQKSATVRKSYTALFYYKDEFFIKLTKEEAKIIAVEKGKKTNPHRGIPVLHIPTNTEYKNIRIGCEILGLNVSTESARLNRNKGNQVFKQIKDERKDI